MRRTELTFLSEAFRARTSAAQGGGPGWRESSGCGRTSPESFAYYDPRTSCWKTCQASVFGGLAMYSGTWPPAGMMRNGSVYRRHRLVPHISELGSGLWPTPVASDLGHRAKPYAQGGRALSYVLGGPTNPRFLEWMMGFPIDWSAVELSGTQSSPNAPTKSSVA